MMYGDLSTQLSPAIVINADLIITLEKKLFGLRTKVSFLLSTRHLLEQWFSKDLAIHIVCIGDYAKEFIGITDMLDTFMTPYNRIIKVDSVEDLDFLISAEHIVGYFYNDESNNLISARTDKRKFYQVPNITEVNYLLDGGLRR